MANNKQYISKKKINTFWTVIVNIQKITLLIVMWESLMEAVIVVLL